MRVTFTTPGLWKVPVGGFVPPYEYANHLARRGHEVRLLHLYYVRADVAAAGLVGIDGRAPENFWFDVDERVDFRVMSLEDEIPDGDVIVNFAFHGPSEPAKGVDVILLQGFGMADELDLGHLDVPAAKVAVARWIYDLSLSHGVPADEIAYVPNAVDHTRFRVVRPIEGRPRRVAMLCNTRLPIKGAANGIEALRLAKALCPDLQAVLFSTDAPPPDLPHWLEFRCLPTPEVLVHDVYNASSVYVCPSVKDGFHLPAVEAMACGCALVSSDLGITEYAEPGVTALVSPPGDVSRLAQNIVRLLNDESLRVRLARDGWRKVQDLSWDTSADALERFFVALCERRRSERSGEARATHVP